MKYQVIKHNKTGTRLLKMADDFKTAQWEITKKGAYFDGLSYVGGFPMFRDEAGKRYSIQGAVFFDTGSHVVCSLDKKELETYGYCA